MFCPKCKSEYIAGYTHCKKCDVDLVDALPEEAPVDEDEFFLVPVCVRTVSNHIEAEMIMDILRQNGIPCYREYLEAGEYLRLYMGYSIYGENIFVDWDACDAASELLDDWDLIRTVESTPDEQYEPCGKPRFFKRPAVVAWTILIVFYILSILTFLIQAVYNLLSLF